MAVEYAIRSLALADPQISGLLGTRWYPNPIPEQPTYPSVGYQVISQVNVSSHQGNSNLATTRIQLSLWATTYDNALTLKEHLKRVLRDFRGTVGSDRLDRVIWANDLSLLDPITQKQQRIIDLLVMHNTVY